MAERVGRHILISGRVQGVFFRQSAVEKARDLGIAGWVRNCANGSVEVHVEGEVDAVELMLDWLRCGPAYAEVDAVQVAEAAPENSARFEIRR